MRTILTRGLAAVITATSASAPTLGADATLAVEAPAASVPADWCGAARLMIAARLVELHEPPDRADRASAQLTPADLEVLMENPEMLQRAGAPDAVDEAFIIGGLIVAGIAVLAANSDDGFVIQN